VIAALITIAPAAQAAWESGERNGRETREMASISMWISILEVLMEINRLQQYRRIEASLRQLLDALPPSVAENDRREAAEKIDHDEFAIALQVIGALIIGYEVALNASSKRQMLEIMREMEMDQDEDYWFWEKMRPVLQPDAGEFRTRSMLMRAICKHLSIVEATGGDRIDAYRGMINPIDYDFGLVKGREYLVFGMSFRRGTAWLYVTHSADPPDISPVPAALFSFAEREIPSEMMLTVSEDGCDAEIIPAAVASFDHWFERYVEDDSEVLHAVANEILRRSR
jgi:hypothetical protein